MFGEPGWGCWARGRGGGAGRGWPCASGAATPPASPSALPTIDACPRKQMHVSVNGCVRK
eukprot:2112051-Rhodomonas_salina.1